jgi:alkylated DNA repair dioxygenase AlkB
VSPHPVVDPPALLWQPGLFGDTRLIDTVSVSVADAQADALAAPPGASLEPDFDRVCRTTLADGAWVDHAPGWMPDPDPLFAAMVDELPWTGAEVEMYGRTVAQPRLSAWWKLGLEPSRAPSVVRAGELAAALDGYYCAGIDAVGCNLYRSGADSVAFHGDRHARNDGDTDAVVAIVSLGSVRRLLLRPKGGGPSSAFTLHPGDLFVMGGSCQRTWQHAIPKAARAGPRISVTFRHPVR